MWEEEEEREQEEDREAREAGHCVGHGDNCLPSPGVRPTKGDEKDEAGSKKRPSPKAGRERGGTETEFGSTRAEI